jgi:dTDP-4-amino-4,6-dideoxygalactose transaminase
MRHNPYKIVKMFEETVADYTGAPFAVSTDNCTDAILLCCEYLNVTDVTIPSKTYLSVPQSIMHAGGTVKFKDYKWKGIYQLEPYPITDNEEAAKWFRKGRYEGRGEVMYHEDSIEINGWNAYMSPEQAARGLMLMQNYPDYVEDLPEKPYYRDLREFPLFKDFEVVE